MQVGVRQITTLNIWFLIGQACRHSPSHYQPHAHMFRSSVPMSELGMSVVGPRISNMPCAQQRCVCQKEIKKVWVAG